MEFHAPADSSTSNSTRSRLRWQEMRCVRCGRLLQKVEVNALRPGKHLEIKCAHCKVMNYLVGVETDSTITVRQKP
jgi:phage FluMu protein Com